MSSSHYGSREGSNPFASLPLRPSSSSSRPSPSPSPPPPPSPSPSPSLPAQTSSSPAAAQRSVRGEFSRGYGDHGSNDDNNPDDGDSEETALAPKRKYDNRLSTASSATAVVTRATSHSQHTWYLEAGALAFSAIAIGLTAGFLQQLDGHRIPNWASVGSGLSLNSILSVLSIVARSSLLIPLDEALGQLMWVSFSRRANRLDEVELFHRASRGPVGALRLIWRKHFRGIASLGSLLVVLSVALGFTQQQLISYPSVSLPYVDPENLTRVSSSNETYNGYQETLPTDNLTAAAGVSNGTTVPVVEFAVSAAVFASLNHYEQHDPLYRCDSGNCEYPPFATLGVCSQCTNATQDDVKHRCDDDGDFCEASYASLTSFAWREADSGTLFSTIINQTADPSLADSIVDTRTLSVNSTHWPPTYTAYACRIIWCVRTVNATVVNATYAETETAVSTASTSRPDGTAVFPYEKPVAAAAGAVVRTEKMEFAVTAKAQTAFKALAQLLTGWSQRSRNDGKWTHSSAFFGGMATFATADMTVGGKHMHRHKPLPVQVIADGMSNAIRSQMTVVGLKVERHTVVSVRWWWLFYPIGVWLLCAFFLAAVVWETRRNEAHFGAWGCSAIALLLWGVDGSVREQVADWNAEGLEAKAHAVRVRLEMDGNVWRMRETDI